MLDLWRDHDPERGMLQVRQLWGDKRVRLTQHSGISTALTSSAGQERRCVCDERAFHALLVAPACVARSVPHTVNPHNVNPRDRQSA